jgi:hypothetical protein
MIKRTHNNLTHNISRFGSHTASVDVLYYCCVFFRFTLLLEREESIVHEMKTSFTHTLVCEFVD